jgi:hypothetical protein
MGQSEIGLFGGVNASKLSGDAPANAAYSSLMGANLGVLLDIKLREDIYLGVQPSYSQEGTKVLYDVAGSDDTMDSVHIHLNYFSLPLILKIASTNKRFYALAGIESSLLLNSSATSGEQEGDINAELAQWNFAMHFGAGIRIPLGFPCLFFELRYSQGLRNLSNEPLNNSIIPRVKTSGFKVMTGIEVPLKRSKN